MTKAAEFREQSVDDLRLREREFEDQLFRLRVQQSMGQAESGVKLKSVRRDLARVKTILKEKA